MFDTLPLGGSVASPVSSAMRLQSILMTMDLTKKHDTSRKKTAQSSRVLFGLIFLFPFYVSSSANATPEFEGRGGEELGTELSNTLYKVFNNKQSVDLKSLCISPGEHCWVLYVDVLVSGSI